MQPTKGEQAKLRAFLKALYRPQVNSWNMNSQVFDLTITLLGKSRQCTDLVDLLPRPGPPGRSLFRWMTKQARGILLRKLEHRKKYYAMCVQTAALGMKSEFWLKAH